MEKHQTVATMSALHKFPSKCSDIDGNTHTLVCLTPAKLTYPKRTKQVVDSYKLSNQKVYDLIEQYNLTVVPGNHDYQGRGL